RCALVRLSRKLLLLSERHIFLPLTESWPAMFVDNRGGQSHGTDANLMTSRRSRYDGFVCVGLVGIRNARHAYLILSDQFLHLCYNSDENNCTHTAYCEPRL